MTPIGSIIKRQLDEQRRSISWLAGQICTDCTNMYRILKKNDLDTDLLRRISVALRHDFFRYYSDELGLDD